MGTHHLTPKYHKIDAAFPRVDIKGLSDASPKKRAAPEGAALEGREVKAIYFARLGEEPGAAWAALIWASTQSVVTDLGRSSGSPRARLQMI